MPLFPGQLSLRAASGLSVCLGLFAVGPARAEIQWENPSVALFSPSGEKIVRTEYRFTNAGPRPVSVVAVEPSCGCVATSLAKSTYAPGEAGVIQVTFDLSMDGLAGVQDRTITVKTDDRAPPTVLQLRVTAVTLAAATPAQVSWERGEAPATKVALVTAKGNVPIAVTLPFRSSRDYGVVITAEPGNRRYRIAITPKSTATPSFAQIHLRAAADAAQPEEVMIYANVN
jgi:hypothetical protein